MSAIELVSGLFSLVLPIVAVVVIVRAVAGRRGGRSAAAPGQLVRRFFQYLLLYGVLMVVASGFATLLGIPGAGASLVDTSGTLARALTFLLIGVPLLVVLWRWTRRMLADLPDESRSLGWLGYLAASSLTAALVTVVAVVTFVSAASRATFDMSALADLIVWGAVWLVHLALEARTTAPENRRLHHLIGSLIGWVVSLVGLIAVLGAALDAVVAPSTDLVGGQAEAIGRAAAWLVAGVPVWLVYWWRAERTAPATPLWYGYVLLVGVGASLVTTVTGVSIALYRVLVWAVGDLGDSATSWSAEARTALAVAAVGGLSWWYHRAVVGERAPAGRTEIVRMHEYLLAALALVAAAVGVALVVVAFIEAVTPSEDVLVDSSLTNSVLAALTLLVVGWPLWWVFWHRIRRAVRADRQAETASPARRTYLYALFGVTGVVTVVVVLVAVYGLLDALLSGTFGAATVRSQRVALGMLVATATLASYHWAVHREDLRLAPPRPAASPAPPVTADRSALESVLLIGPADDALVDAVREATTARVELWVQEAGRWDRQTVLGAIDRATRRQVVLHAEGEQMIEAGALR